MIFRIILAMVIGGCMLVFFGIQEMRLSSHSKSEAQRITCSQLVQSGPGDNSHVHLTDFLVCDMAYVYKGSKDGGKFQTVWVPLLPIDDVTKRYVVEVVKAQKANQTPPMPKDIKVILQTDTVKSEGEMDSFGSTEELEGTIVNSISSLGKEEQRILSQSYPGIDFNNVYIIEHNRHPSTGKGIGMMGGGASLAGLGAFLFIRRRNS